MISIPSVQSKFGISFSQLGDARYTFQLFRPARNALLNASSVTVSKADILAFQQSLQESIQKGTRSYWIADGPPRLEIQVFQVPLYDKVWAQERLKKFPKWPIPTKQQKIQMKKNARIIQAQGGYLPCQEYVFRIFMGEKGSSPQPIVLLFTLKNLQKIDQYFN